MLALLPIIGPIIQGLIVPLINGGISIFNKYADTKVELYKTDADVYKTEVTSSVDIIKATESDPGTRLARDLIIVPTAAYVAIYVWDRTVDHHWPQLVMNVEPLTALPYLVYAVLTYLLGRTALGVWRRG